MHPIVLLLDIDGVLQFGVPAMQEHMTSIGWQGEFEVFITSLFSDSEYQDCLVSKASIESVLTRKLNEFNQPMKIEAFLKEWCGGNLVSNSALLDLLPEMKVNQICLASNQDALRGKYMRCFFGRHSRIRQMFFSFEIGFRKPDPRFYTHIMQSLQVEPHEIVFVDDDQRNVSAARNLGINGIQFTDTNSLVRELVGHNALGG